MSVQTNYSFQASKGAAGGIVDLAPYEINTLLNGEENGVMTVGIGVVQGEKVGVDAKIPTVAATADKFEGVVTNNRTTEFDLDGKLFLRKGAALGVMRWGRVYVRVKEGVTPAYGEKLYLVTSGTEAGFFTNTAGENTIAIKGRFIGTVDRFGAVAAVELFNQANEAAPVDEIGATKVSELTDVDLTTPPTDGQVLKYDGTAEKWVPANDATE